MNRTGKSSSPVTLERDVWVTRAREALAAGPLSPERLARAIGVRPAELVANAAVLRGVVEAMRVGDAWLLYRRDEPWSRLWEARAALLKRDERRAA